MSDFTQSDQGAAGKSSYIHFCSSKPLHDITEEQLRQYWLCCQNEFGWSAATLGISYSGIQHFFTKTRVRSWTIFKFLPFRVKYPMEAGTDLTNDPEPERSQKDHLCPAH